MKDHLLLNRSNVLLKLLYTLSVLLIGSCGKEDHAGGVDANTNFLQGQLLLPGSAEPAVGARVHLRQNEQVVDSTRTDSVGMYRFLLSKSGAYQIDAMVGDSALMKQYIQFELGDSIRIPAQELPLPSTSMTILADFESTEVTEALSRWFANADSWVLYVSDETLLGATANRVDECDTHGGCAYLNSLVLGDGGEFVVAEYRNLLRPYISQCVPIPDADSLTLIAKGTGNLFIAAWGMNAAGDWESNQIESNQYELGTDWKSYQFDISTMEQECLHKVVIGIQGAGELWFDDLKIHGVNLLDLDL